MSIESHPRRTSRHREPRIDATEPIAPTADRQDVNANPEQERESDGAPPNLAHPLRRAYAFLIDIGLMLAVVYMVAPFAGGRLFSATSAIIDVFVFFGYFVFTTGFFGRTVGKWVAGIKVVDGDGNTPGVAVAIPREMAGRFVAVVAVGIGLFWIAFDPKHQGWHDKIAGTYVVNHGNAGPSFLSRFFYPNESATDDRKNKPKANARVGNRSSDQRRRKRKKGRVR